MCRATVGVVSNCRIEGALGKLLRTSIDVHTRFVGRTVLVLCVAACSDRVALEHEDERGTDMETDETTRDEPESDAGETSSRGQQEDSSVVVSPEQTGADGTDPGVSDTTGTGTTASGGETRDGGVSPDETGFTPNEEPLPTLPVVEPDPIDIQAGPATPAIAVQLARFIWREAPDATTVDLARRGKLVSARDVYEEAQRLLADPRSERGFRSFFGAWTEVTRSEELETGSRSDAGTFGTDAGVFGTSEYVDALRAELYDFALGVVESEGTFSELLVAPFQIQQPLLSQTFDGEPITSRDGLLAQPLLLAAGSYSDRTSPSRRGAFIARRLLCRDLSPVDHMLNGEVPAGSSVREWIVGETSEDECADCHSVIDPLGFAFEGFDQMGKARTEDGGQEINSESSLAALGLGRVSTPRDLGLALVSHPDAMPCFLSHWFEYALQRELSAGDLQSWVKLERGAEFYALKEIPALIVSSDAFRAQAAD